MMFGLFPFNSRVTVFKLDLAAASMTLVLPVKATFNFHVRRDGSTGSWSVSDDEVENTGRETSFLQEGTHANSRERGESEAGKRTFWFDDVGRWMEDRYVTFMTMVFPVARAAPTFHAHYPHPPQSLQRLL
jgi:hypothetical protein